MKTASPKYETVKYHTIRSMIFTIPEQDILKPTILESNDLEDLK